MDDPVVTIERFEFLPEAEAIRMRLESGGIEVFLADKETVNTDWVLGNAIGYIKLQVRQSQAEAARAVIEEIRELSKARTNDTTNRCLACDAVIPASTVCPQCGWTYESDEMEFNESLSTTDDVASPGLLESLRELKKLMMIVILAPAIAAVVVTAIAIVFTILDSTFRE